MRKGTLELLFAGHTGPCVTSLQACFFLPGVNNVAFVLQKGSFQEEVTIGRPRWVRQRLREP